MKDNAKALLACVAITAGVFLLIHRRVIAAALTGSEMPEPPEWHKKYFPCFRQQDEI